MSRIGDSIKDLRLRNNMSQDALAEKLNVTRQAISNWENSKTQPDANTLNNLGIIFNVSVDEIINNDFYKSKNRKTYYILLPIGSSLLSLVHCILAFLGYYNPFGAMSSVVSASAIALIMYLTIEYSIKNRDFTMLAGHKKIYEKDVYLYEKKLRSMSLQVAGIAVLLNILYFLIIFVKKENQMPVSMIFFAIFIVGMIVIIGIKNLKYKKQGYEGD